MGQFTESDNKKEKPTSSNKAGQSLHKMAVYYRGMHKVDLFFLGFFGISAILILIMGFGLHKTLIAYIAYGCIVAEVLYALFIVIREKINDKKKIWGFSSGEAGEVRIGEELKRLGKDYFIWHDIPGTLGNIDHLILNKKGQLFLIETKAISGRVTFKGNQMLINGSKPDKDIINQCLKNIYYMQDKIFEVTRVKPWVNVIVVFTNAWVDDHEPIKNIEFTYAKKLLYTIQQVSRKRGQVPGMMEKLAELENIFSQENLTFEEFRRKNFDRISGFGINN